MIYLTKYHVFHWSNAAPGVRYIHRCIMREPENVSERYICPNCGRKYNAVSFTNPPRMVWVYFEPGHVSYKFADEIIDADPNFKVHTETHNCFPADPIPFSSTAISICPHCGQQYHVEERPGIAQQKILIWVATEREFIKIENIFSEIGDFGDLL